MINPMWDASLDSLAAQLEAMPAGSDTISPSLRESIKSQESWATDRQVATYGQLPVEKLIPLCREGLVDWWLPMTGKALLGDLEAMRKLWEAIETDFGTGRKPSIDSDSVMAWLCLPDSLVSAGYPVKTTPEVFKQVFDWGAKPDHDNNKWQKLAFERLSLDCMRAFIAAGASATGVLQSLEELAASKKTEQLGRLRQAITGQNLYAKVDDDTLLEVKYIPDSARGSMLRTVFNFAARRVQEIYEPGNGAAPLMTSATFDDYASAALERAAEKLVKCGGKPQAVLDKPKRVAGLSAKN